MGKVIAEAQMENLDDVFGARQSRISPDAIRKLIVSEALVDTGASMLCMPRSMIDTLGLLELRKRKVRTDGGTRDFSVFGMVRLSVLGREANLEVGEIAEGCPVLIGQIPLEVLDFIVDPIRQRLVGNPDHSHEQMYDALGEY